jgi:putative MATE family efflux protein
MDPILRLILADSEALVYEYSAIYLSYCILSIPFLSVYYVSTSAIRGSGKPNLSLIAALIYNGSYALMSVLAVIWFDAGIVGVSMAMLLSRAFSAVAGMYLLRRGNENMKVERILSFRFEKQIIKPVVLVSIPICLENLLFQGGKMVTQTFAVPFGTSAIAVNGIVNNLFGLMMVPGGTAANAVVPIVGRYVGMRDFGAARKKAAQFLLLSTAAAALTSAVIYAFTPSLARFYTAIPEVQAQILSITGLCCLVVPFLWAPSFITPAALRGAGDVRYTTFVAVLSMLILRIGSSYLLAIVMGLGVQGIWIGMYADWVLRAICFQWRIRGDQWLQKSML